MIEAYPVSWLTSYLKELIDSDLRLSDIWVEGEVSNLTRSSAGHRYFTLKDANAQVRCVMFRRADRDGAPIESGAQVLAHGNVSIYEVRGELQLIVDFVEPAGMGVWQAQFERLKEQLETEGLFEPARKRLLPPFPRRVGVVTSPTGAVFHDICHVVGRRWPIAEIVLAPTPVQGAEAVPGIVAALRRLNEEAAIDVIILARGGGSIEELWAFNEEAVARAVFGSRVPVVAGVGHETDYTIADYVADVRAPTPSAAAETVVPDRADVTRRVEGMALSLQTWTAGQVNQGGASSAALIQRLRRSQPDLSPLGQRLAGLVRAAEVALERATSRRGEGLSSFVAQLRSLDPRRTMARGYAVVQKRDDKQVVTSMRQVEGRDRLTVHVQDGSFPAEVSRQYGF
ncbi:MAG TPA: exodeoxyribonuclease VII large subunit [Dehalococcoidia bacterium]|nr:exodeoxyribonuclease VII large subunit [Dehalococcoidia bacterium]